jgi:hypothetical protein
MGFFDSVNVDDIPDNPNELPNNTYKFQVISAELKPTKNNDKTGITFKYQIVEGAWSNFFPLVDWCRVPDNNVKPDEVQRMLSYLKMRLIAFGFSPEEIQAFDPDDVSKCVGREFYGTTSAKKDGENTQIRVQRFDPIGDGMVDFPDADI